MLSVQQLKVGADNLSNPRKDRVDTTLPGS